MMSFPTIHMPQEFCEILQKDTDRQWTRINDQNESLFGTLIQSESLIKLIEISFAHLYPTGKVQHYLRSLGWKNFRDRLASIYLHHARTNQFPAYTTLDTIDDLLRQETELNKFSASGQSRIFLLLLYLEFIQIHMSKNAEIKHLSSNYTVPEAVVTFISSHKQKVWESDYFIIILWHFYIYWGEEIFLQLKEKKGKIYFDSFWEKMSLDQRRLLVENLLSYSNSIRDHQLFLKQI